MRDNRREFALSLKIKLLRNSLANYFIRFWSWIVAFFLFPFIVHHLGINAAGIWLLVSSITGYFTLFDLGIGSSLTKYVAQYKAQKDEQRLSQSISTTFFIFSVMGLVATVGLFIIGRFFITVFNIPTELIHEARIITYITGATMLFGFPMATFNGILRGLQRYDLSALIGFIVSVPQIALTIIFLLQGYGVVALVLINSACGALGWLLNLYYAKRLLPSLHISIPLFNKAMVRTLFGLAIAIFIIDACVMIMTHTDKLIIGAFLTAGMIPFYEAAYKIFRLMAIAPMLLGKAVLPAASELDAFHDIHSLQSLFLRGTKYTTAIFLAIAIPATLLSKQILIYWMGKEFGSHYLLIAIFVLFELFSFHYLFALNLLIGINKVKVALFYHIGSAMLNLILSIILVQRIGLIGVVWGTAIPAIVLVPVFMLYILKTFKVDLITYFKQVIGRTYPQAGIIALLLYVVTLYHLPRSLGEVGIFAILSIGAYFALFYLFGTAAWEKKDLIAMGRGVCLVK